MDRQIILQDLKQPADLFRLQEYLKELYRLVDPRFIAVDYAAAITFDADEAEVFYVELTGNITGIAIKNAYKGRKVTIVFKQDSIGSRTVAGWESNVKLAGASFTPTTTASAYSTITLVYNDTNWVEVARTTDVR